VATEIDDDLMTAVIEDLNDADIHTVEVAHVDTLGHMRGKRVPVDRFIGSVASGGCHIADAIFIFDAANDLVESPYVSMDGGFLDTHLVPDLSTTRIFTHRDGYAIVMADSYDPDGNPHTLSPRNVLAAQVERCQALGLDPVVATEMEFYLCNPDWSPIQDHIQYSSLTDSPHVEVVLHDIRTALLGAGIPVESSNLEYGPGQIEINVSAADAMTTADNTLLYKSIVKEIAERHGLKATFMSKIWEKQSGSGMHVHTSLNDDEGNAFRDAVDGPNELMSHWVAGQLEHAAALSLLGSPMPYAHKRVRPYTFAPTHIHWGLDNRSVLCRCTVGAGSANRVEYRAAGADANPYLIIAGLLAAGADGVERSLELPASADGDMYAEPGAHEALSVSIEAAIDAFDGSALAAALGEEFSTNYVLVARHEAAALAEAGGDSAADSISDWERARYIEHI
jgi:glutamine synthetase